MSVFKTVDGRLREALALDHDGTLACELAERLEHERIRWRTLAGDPAQAQAQSVTEAYVLALQVLERLAPRLRT